jgi:hypothetical protein
MCPAINDLERTTLAGRARFGRPALHPPGRENLACARGIRQTIPSGSQYEMAVEATTDGLDGVRPGLG